MGEKEYGREGYGREGDMGERGVGGKGCGSVHIDNMWGTGGVVLKFLSK